MKTLEQYLKENFERNVIDHALRANVAEDGTVSFYIHPANANGETPGFVVSGNELQLDPKVQPLETA